MLRVLDIPEALGLLAPTPLTIIGGLDPALAGGWVITFFIAEFFTDRNY